MQFVRAFCGIASACLVSVLTACGGGGGGDDPRTSTVTLPVATSAYAAGTYTTQRYDKTVEDTGTSLGRSTTMEFHFPNMEAAFSYINNNPDIYIIGYSDDSGNYMCGSALANAAIGVLTCPSDVQFDLRRKTVIFNNAAMEDMDGIRPNVTVSGNLQWN